MTANIWENLIKTCHTSCYTVLVKGAPGPQMHRNEGWKISDIMKSSAKLAQAVEIAEVMEEFSPPCCICGLVLNPRMQIRVWNLSEA